MVNRSHETDATPGAPAVGGGADEPGHGMAHVLSVRLLVAVWAALMVLTLLTVAATHLDLGASTNLGIAMAIATVKASLVMAFFMHLLFDRRFNLLVFLSGVLFVVLLISSLVTDRAEYQPAIDQYEAAKAAAAATAESL